jgi:hypothetical protein
MTPLEERFWRKVTKTDSCWVWSASRNGKGYGQINRNKKPVLAHRLSWELHFGKIPEDRSVLHRCDNPACVRPDHLFLGTQADNIADMVKKGRVAAGTRLPHTKLTDAQVLEIRQAYRGNVKYTNGPSLKELAKKYGVGSVEIHNIVKRKRRTGVEEKIDA